MVELDGRLRAHLGVALNEANLLDVVLDAERATCALWFDVLTLPPSDAARPNRRAKRQLRLERVGRLIAGVRVPTAQDPNPPGEPFGIEALSGVVRRFGGQPVYGWEFLDRVIPEHEAAWMLHPSVDWVGAAPPGRHTIDLFQEEAFGVPGVESKLDLRIWFDSLTVTTGAGEPIDLQDFVAGGTRWWDGLSAGDPRTTGPVVPSGE